MALSCGSLSDDFGEVGQLREGSQRRLFVLVLSLNDCVCVGTRACVCVFVLVFATY